MKDFMRISSACVMAVGVLLVLGGIGGICFTYRNVARENIVTPDDAAIPNAPVRGPLTLKAQADIIREHALETTGGKTFAEMPRQIPKLDADGSPVLDEEGKPAMAPNAARDIWITVTALTTALNLAILAYALSALVILGGLVLVWAGVCFRALGAGKQG